MPVIILSGEIGWDVTPQLVRDKLQAAKRDEDLDLHLSTPGGYVYPGIEIYNLLRDFKRQNPATQMLITMKSWVMSMGSYIASVEGADLVAVEDNAVFMLHNPLMMGDGDYRDHQKNADYLKALADLLAISYARKSGKSLKEIKSMMDDETYLFGEEIVKAGFADTLIETEQKREKSILVSQAKLNIVMLINKIKHSNNAKEDIQQIAAIFKQQTSVSNALNIPASGGNISEEIMDRKEFQAKHPDLYAEVEQAGKDAGLKEGEVNGKASGEKAERERVNKLMTMKKKPEYARIPAVLETIDKAISEGTSYDETQPLVMAVLANPNIQAALESPDAIATGQNNATGSGESNNQPEGKKTIREV